MNSATSTEIDIANVSEWAGVATSAALDVAANNSNTGTSASAGSINPAGSGDLVISSAYAAAGASALSPSIGTALTPAAFNLAVSPFSSVTRGYGAYYVAPDSNAITTTWTVPNGNWTAATASFLP